MDEIKIEKTTFYKVVSRINILLVIVFLLYFILTITGVPQDVPMHFNAEGEVTRYGDRAELWILFVFLCLMQLLFIGIKKVPTLWNVPTSKNEDKIQIQYQLTAHFLCCMQLFITLLFITLYLTIMYQPSTMVFNLVFPMGFFFIILIVYLYKILKLRK